MEAVPVLGPTWLDEGDGRDDAMAQKVTGSAP